MRLSAKTLKNYANINNFDYEPNGWVVRESEPNRLCLQLVDLDQDGLRFLSSAAAYSLKAIFPAIDDDDEFEIAAVQADALDRSVWYLDLSSSQVPSSGSVMFEFTQDGVVRRFTLDFAISVEGQDQGGCC